MKYPIGTTYQPIGKSYVCTIIDHLTSRLSSGQIYRERYVVTYEFLGSQTDYDVVETTVARGLGRVGAIK